MYWRRPQTSLIGFTATLAAFGVSLFVSTARAQDEEDDTGRGSGSVPSGISGAVVRPPEEPDEAEPRKPVVVEPKLVQFHEAQYPKEAQEKGLQAEVLLHLTLDKTGKVTAVKVVEPAGHGFDEAAQAAAMQFVFEPATRNGKPVSVIVPYRYRFELKPVTPEEAPPPPPPTTGNLEGKVYIAGTDIPLVGAEVVVVAPDGKETRLTSDDQGKWSLVDLPPGEYTVRVNSAGYEPTENVETVTAGEVVGITYRIAPEVEGLEVTVKGERPPREVTRRTIERREIARIPGTGGDALRSIQNLPGVARPPGLAGLLIVRGSSPRDTQTFIDGANVPLIYHFGGLSSTVPTEMLDRIDFYPGNFSAKYGRVMGGIVDVALREPNIKCNGPYGKKSDEKGCYHGLAEFDLIKGRAMLEGPILGSEDWTFAMAAQRSWFDVWLKPVLKEAGAGVTTAPIYYDYQVIAENKPDRNSRLSLRALGADDRVEILITDPAAEDPAFGGNITFRTASHSGQVLYETELDRNVNLNSMFSVGKTELEFSVGSLLAFYIDYYPIQMRNEFGWKLVKGVTLNAGMDFLVAPYDISVRAPQPPREGEPDPGPFAARPPIETSEKGTIFRPAWYLEGELQPTRRLRVVPGLRLDYARDSGRADWSPRINARYDIVPSTAADEDEDLALAGKRHLRTTAKGGVGLYYQPPDFQETNEVYGTPGIGSNRAIHYALGIEQELSKQVELSVEGFYKDLDSLVARAPSGAGFAYGNSGDGSVIGLETLLKYKPDKRFFGWVAYTLSRSVRRDAPGEEEYLFDFDQTHNLILLGSYRLARGWEFGARFRVVSGNLETPVVRAPELTSLYSSDGAAYAAIQGDRTERLPLFHQLDLRIDKRWQFEYWRFATYLDVQNVYNNRAVEGTNYNYNYSQRSRIRGVPILPSIGVRGEF
jgi:TonB family protein